MHMRISSREIFCTSNRKDMFMGKYFEQEYSETFMKSGICAKEKQDFERLACRQSQFLDCHVEEEKETVIFYYDIREKASSVLLREEKKTDRIKALLEAGKLRCLFREYHFELNPQNLYYDRNYRVFVKSRDVYERGFAGDDTEFLTCFKALTGHVMQNKYSYEDYLQGGSDLYQKNSFLKTIKDTETIDEFEQQLETEYQRLHDIAVKKKVEVNKSWYRLSSLCMTIAILLIVAVAGVIAYLAGVILPRKSAMLNASSAYLEGNYVRVIDDLKQIDMKYMDKYQKYILAASYVRSESLTQEQKDNILRTITIDGEEKAKDYWIYLGRLNTLEAQNVAMQRSDDELLLYAYMTEKAILEKNTEVTGEEKAARLSELEKKIEELAEPYQAEENQNRGSVNK